MAESLRILQVNTLEKIGGAALIAWNLHCEYLRRGMTSWMAVQGKTSNDEHVFVIPAVSEPVNRGYVRGLLLSGYGRLRQYHGKMRGAWLLSRLLFYLANLAALGGNLAESSEFNCPESRQLLKLLPDAPDIIHGHNLHGGYFDLGMLPELSRRFPVVLTLHDAWLLSGHCAHSFACEKWKTGCGHCPDLTIPPAVAKDITDRLWGEKRHLFQKSRLFIATPSHWLMEKVRQSMLMSAVVESRVIPNGVDLSIYYPYDKQKARDALGLPQDAKILVFAANGIRESIWKDYHTMREALAKVADTLASEQILFLAVGEDASPEKTGCALIQFVPYNKDQSQMALYYQAADIYLHAARADTFPNTVIEALACGTPVVATAVGGIPEQVRRLCSGCDENEATGILTHPGDSGSMADAIVNLLGNDVLCRQLGRNAAEDAAKRFDLTRQADDYLSWYREVLSKRIRGH